MYTLSKKTLDFLSREPKLFINNQWVESSSNQAFESYDPGNGEELCKIAQASEQNVDEAVQIARDFFEKKALKLATTDRAKLLNDLANLMERDLIVLQELESLDNGKPLDKAEYDIKGAIAHFRYFAGWADKIEGSQIPVSNPRTLVYTRKEALGVVGLIVPWNFPLMITAWKVAPALACGNAAILKPAEQTSLTALYLAELSLEAGFPSGWFQVLTGDGQVGSMLSHHLDIDKISFTGSTSVGKKILAASAASNLKKTGLELGGKSPNIIFADADLRKVKASIVWSSFYNSGQECTLGSRIYVEESIAEEITQHLVDSAKKLRIGYGLANPDLGPLISEEQRIRVEKYIQIGHKDGECLVGGKRPEAPYLATGYFLEPTVFRIQNQDSLLVQEEIFGPVVTITTFNTKEEALAMANNSIYGLAAAVWTQNLKTAHSFAHQLKAGTIWLNGYDMFDAAVPFGGYKQSGIGREMGKSAIDLFTQEKAVWLAL
jgi:aldehyde dehydrogenase (NAD+)/phenylacetaldehyde dehydrogenase